MPAPERRGARATLATAVVLSIALLGSPARAERAIEIAGYLGRYDAATIPVWPERLQLLMGRPDVEGRLVAEARRRARAAHNPARFFFYLSLSSLDGRCDCYESEALARLRREHPDLLLRDAGGEPVSTFLDQLPPGRQLTTDLGNPAYAAWWAGLALEEIRRHGWDGVFADNIVRGEFRDGSWSAVPVNPRTQRPYTTAEYRTDMLATLRAVHARLATAGALVIGNPGAAWRSFDDDPVLVDQALALDGVEIEDFAYTFRGAPQGEADWIRQLRYLDLVNRRGVLTWAGGEALMHPEKREYVLASYLLTRRGRSVVGDLNAAKTWWPAFDEELGSATADFYCLDPGTGFARSADCPKPGRVVARDFTHARVLVNPGDGTQRVPLGGAFRGLDGAPAPDPLPLDGHTGRVVLRADHTASRTCSGRDGR
jgi:hypothetical protein